MVDGHSPVVYTNQYSWRYVKMYFYLDMHDALLTFSDPDSDCGPSSILFLLLAVRIGI